MLDHRLYADVIDLKPAAMIVLAGTNDVAHNTGPTTAEMIEENIMAMTELALYRFVLDKLAGLGFLPVLPPVLAGEQAMYGTGFLPTEESNLYRL